MHPLVLLWAVLTVFSVSYSFVLPNPSVIKRFKFKMDSGVLHTDVCIVGGGIGGLSAAISLQNIGCNVKVFERDGDFADRKQGYGLTLTNNIKGPLAQLGVLDECIAQNCLSKSHYVFNEKGHVLGYYGRAFKAEEEKIRTENNDMGGSRGNLRIPRQDLREMMMKKLKRDTVVWNRKLVDYVEHPSHVLATFEFKSKFGELVYQDVHCKVLVGADGVRSIVRQLRDKKDRIEHLSPLNYLGVAVIIGLSTVSHPLLHNRGFYVVDGRNRMFTMPFLDPHSSSTTSSSGSGNNGIPSTSQQRNEQYQDKSLTMWQLSFSGLSEQEALQLRSLSHKELLAEADRRTRGWFPPVADMIRSTADGEVWGTPLYDRDAMPLKRKDKGSRITVIGDACHPMSMFKGQGANQALEDGPLLARWLSEDTPGTKKKEKRKLDDNDTSSKEKLNIFVPAADGNEVSPEVVYTRLRCFEREMVARSASKATGSRQAALHYHSPSALTETYGIEGVDAEDLEMYNVVGRLAQDKVTADLAGELDDKLREKLEFLEVIG